MRYQGRITEWNDDRGFGFITPNGGGPRVFIHFRALQLGEPRPNGGELVTYVEVPVSGKGPRAEQVAYVERVSHQRLQHANPPKVGAGNTLKAVVALGIVLTIGFLAAQKYGEKRNSYRPAPQVVESVAPAPTPSVAPLATRVTSGSQVTSFKCEGKTRCSQMTSCEEATFYLKNCPGVKIDGDNDGIPCERELCN